MVAKLFKKSTFKRSLILGLSGFALAATVRCSSIQEDERIASKLAIQSSELDGGVFSGIFTAASNQAQLLSATSGSAGGSSVLIPPGALSFDLSVTVAATTSLANSAQAGDLGIAAAIAAAGPAVFFQPSQTVVLTQPMQISIPIQATALMLGEDANYAVVYKCLGLKDGQTVTYSGLIPRSKMVIQNGLAKINVSRFGAYQVVTTSEPVTNAIEQPSTFDIGKAPGSELVGTWERACEEESNSSGGSASVTWYTKESLTFDGSKASVVRKGFITQDECGNGGVNSNYFETTFVATYEVGAVVTTTNTPTTASVSPRAFDAVMGSTYGQIVYDSDSQSYSDICGISGNFPSGKNLIPNDECMAKIFDSNASPNTESNIGQKILSSVVITRDSPAHLYLAEGQGDHQIGDRQTAFDSERYYTKVSTTH